MRTAFIETLFNLAKINKNIVLIVGDLGFGVVDKFQKELPDQFINAGVAEQNMTGVAAGLAMSGKIVFTYSIGNFPTMRCYEQIRNDICYHEAPVIITSIGGGFSYGALGATHHATEDIAIMRALPNITVISPADPVETKLAVTSLVKFKRPAYLRLGRAKEPIIHKSEPNYFIGRAINIMEGDDVNIIATGAILFNCIKAAEELNRIGIHTGVISMHTIKPIDKDTIINLCKRSKIIVTVEEHSIVGGLGSAVSEIIMESGIKPQKFKRIGIPDEFSKTSGDQEYLRKMYGLDIKGLVNTIIDLSK
jgi:transketolase